MLTVGGALGKCVQCDLKLSCGDMVLAFMLQPPLYTWEAGDIIRAPLRV